ncbi:MAG TPA: hypothetical protein VF839_03890 [Clostridium sp.]
MENHSTTIIMFDLMTSSNEILTMITQNILRANTIGTYNGAYGVIELAVKEGKKDSYERIY